MDFVLSDYINRAMSQAEYDKLEDGTFSGRIPECTGVVAFAASLAECENKLRSVLEDWTNWVKRLDSKDSWTNSSRSFAFI